MKSLPEDICKKQFLVVDDYESMLAMIGEQLSKLGIQRILYAKSGNQAYKLIKQNLGKPEQIDFVLTDMVMEDGNGIDLLKDIRADSSMKSLPVIMITSKADVEFVIEAAKSKVSSYIIKPWKLEDLYKKIVDCNR